MGGLMPDRQENAIRPAMAPIQATSLADGALSKIIEAITIGEFGPGAKLSEVDLARQLGISRGPLREALGRLEGSLVERTPRLGFSVIRLTEADLADQLAMREALEGMACRLAAERITPDDVAEFRDLLAGRDTASRRRDGYLRRDMDDRFHLLVLRCARSPRIAETLRRDVYFPLQLYRFSGSARPGGAEAALKEHRAIVDALEAHDGDAAEARMREHLRNAVICYQATSPHGVNGRQQTPAQTRTT
jgi:DNA-binding GntR family transcriptional regulator